MTQPAAPDSIVLPAAPPQPVAAPPAQQLDLNDPRVTAAIEAARQQEKDKLYTRLDEEKKAREAIEQRVAAFDTDLATRQQAEEDARKAAEAAAEEKRQAELSFKEQLVETETRFQTQLGTLEQQIAQKDAVLEKEREFHALMQYRDRALQSETGQSILPELRDMVIGNTVEEIDASISALADRSGSILQQVAQATGAARQNARGVGVTAPPVGPLDNNSGYETVSVDDIRGMDMNTYAQNRGRLLGAAAQQQRDRGMFG